MRPSMTMRILFQESKICTPKPAFADVPEMEDWCNTACNDENPVLCKPNLCQCTPKVDWNKGGS